MLRNKELFSENLTYLNISVVKIDHVNTVRRLVELNVGIEVMDYFCSNSPLRGMFAVDRHDCFALWSCWLGDLLSRCDKPCVLV
jgi:hypothetical protein